MRHLEVNKYAGQILTLHNECVRTPSYRKMMFNKDLKIGSKGHSGPPLGLNLSLISVDYTWKTFAIIFGSSQINVFL